jgi:hypothetical protein
MGRAIVTLIDDPDWLDESIIKIDFIEDFRKELKEKGIV